MMGVIGVLGQDLWFMGLWLMGFWFECLWFMVYGFMGLWFICLWVIQKLRALEILLIIKS